MDTLSHDRTDRNRLSATNRLPYPDPLAMDYAARRIATRYNVSAGMARVVAELVGASIAECRR
jgi:hypothetical protein